MISSPYPDTYSRASHTTRSRAQHGRGESFCCAYLPVLTCSFSAAVLKSIGIYHLHCEQPFAPNPPQSRLWTRAPSREGFHVYLSIASRASAQKAFLSPKIETFTRRL